MKKLFDLKLEQTEDIFIEGTRRGDLLLSVGGSGAITGERINGKILPVGLCTTYTPESGRNIIHVPCLIETDDGAKIFMEIDAYLHLSQELEDKMLAGEKVSEDEYYYKGTVRFDVGDEKYKWMEDRVFTCRSIIDDWSSLRFEVFEI